VVVVVVVSVWCGVVVGAPMNGPKKGKSDEDEDDDEEGRSASHQRVVYWLRLMVVVERAVSSKGMHKVKEIFYT
jgi:hypothetical protein